MTRTILLTLLLAGLIGCKTATKELVRDPLWDARYDQSKRDLAIEMRLIRANHGLIAPADRKPFADDMQWLAANMADGKPYWDSQFDRAMDLTSCHIMIVTDILADGPTHAGNEDPDTDNCIAYGRPKP